MSDNNEGVFSCQALCWIAGALLGLATFLILHGGIGNFLALILGLVILVAVALLLRSMFCGEVSGAGTGSAPMQGTTSAATAGGAAHATAKPAAPAEAAIEGTPPPIGGATAHAAADAAPAPKAKAKDAPAGEAKAKAPEGAGSGGAAAKKTGGKKAPGAGGAKADGAPAKPSSKSASGRKAPQADMADAGPESAPETLDAPRGGKADDLKMIKGVGPKLEQTLNELGFWHFSQVAAWSQEEITWVDNRLKFKGRITRDGWIDQASTLAAGGETEFSTRAAKSGTYSKKKKG